MVPAQDGWKGQMACIAGSPPSSKRPRLAATRKYASHRNGRVTHHGPLPATEAALRSGFQKGESCGAKERTGVLPSCTVVAVWAARPYGSGWTETVRDRPKGQQGSLSRSFRLPAAGPQTGKGAWKMPVATPAEVNQR